jgi:hypothetical protein
MCLWRPVRRLSAHRRKADRQLVGIAKGNMSISQNPDLASDYVIKSANQNLS